MRPQIILPFLLLLFTACSIQKSPSDRVKEQATEMIQHYQDGNFGKYVEYLYPPMLDTFGGRTELLRSLEQGSEEMKRDSFSIVKLWVMPPSPMVTEGNQLQCTMTEILEIETPRLHIKVQSTLIGLSDDRGKNWHFMEAPDTVMPYRMVPGLSRQLDITSRTEPVITPR